jgi:hypothetical protein
MKAVVIDSVERLTTKRRFLRLTLWTCDATPPYSLAVANHPQTPDCTPPPSGCSVSVLQRSPLGRENSFSLGFSRSILATDPRDSTPTRITRQTTAYQPPSETSRLAAYRVVDCAPWLRRRSHRPHRLYVRLQSQWQINRKRHIMLQTRPSHRARFRFPGLLQSNRRKWTATSILRRRLVSHHQ